MARASGGFFAPSSWSPGHGVLGIFEENQYHHERSASEGRTPDVPPLLDPMQIPWYHPHLTRNLAEAELQKAEEGVYLMRPRYDQHSSSLKGFAIDVRDTHAVKHFQVKLNQGGLWSFGQETFTSIPTFLEHFDNRPLLGDDAGRLIVLKYAYPRDVEENPDYHSSVTTHFLSNPPKEKIISPRMIQRSHSESELISSPGNHSQSSADSSDAGTEDGTSVHSLSLASKAGYLVKMGGRVKSWKRRYFVLKDRYLSYYVKETETRPLRVIDLSQAASVSYSDEAEDRPNMFKIVLPWRTFYLQAQNAELRKDWVDLLSWRLREIQRLPKRRQT